MTRLDVQWALEEIARFLHCTAQVGYNNDPGSGVVFVGTTMRGSPVEAAEAAHVVEQILDRVMTGWRSNLREPASSKPQDRWKPLREMAARAQAQLRRAEELADKLGDGAPQLDAGQLHRWVWQPARQLWNSGHYREAVAAAAVGVNAKTQAKVGRRDVAETALFQQIFSISADPVAGKPHLHVIPDDGSKTFSNRQRGAAHLAEGLFAGIRNGVAHDPQDAPLSEHEALEQLAAFSILARWVDRSTLHEA